ncbi:MAG: polyprenyl synthetase family protein [Lactobacillus sp.]|nr:polyprenyl synthetase family protein [Lactobacillus sp.]
MLMTNNYQDFSNAILPKLEATFKTQLQQTITQPDLRSAMTYSLEVGGKRLRPLLLLSVVDTFKGIEAPAYLPAAALELVHTYSLIHDDLPAMDNDALRRGQPSNHVKFGVGQAILAGDGLLTLAFEWLAQSQYPAPIQIKLVQLLSHAAGPSEMVAGQYTDISLSDQANDLAVLRVMEMQKTAALINAAVLMGATISQVDVNTYGQLDLFSKYFGLAFQIADDIADFKTGQDTEEHKATFATELGLDKAQAYLDETVAQAKAALNAIKNVDLSLLQSYFEYFKAAA